MTTKEMIEVMQAYERGEQIEYRMKTIPENNEWVTMTQEPEWNWTEFEYRVKPKPTYRPYKNAGEFLKAQWEHGMYLRDKVSRELVIPLCVNDYRVILPDNGQELTAKYFLYVNLLDCFVWQDGTPCGVKEE